MKITVCGSIAFYTQMEELKTALEAEGHEVLIPLLSNEVPKYGNDRKINFAKYIEENGGIDAFPPTHEIWDIKKNAIDDHFRKIEWADAIVVANYEKRGIEGYIGGNTLIEIGIAFYLGKGIYVLNPISSELSYKQEIYGMKVVLLNDDVKKIAGNLDLPDTIVVASGSAIKVDTVANVLKKIFPARAFTVRGIKASSGVNEQPVGDEAAQGARERLADAKRIYAAENSAPAAFVSIESGIFEDDRGWEDKAFVFVELPDGRSASALSKGVPFPADAVDAARGKPGGFKEHTVGSVLAEQYAARGQAMDKQNPQTILTGGKLGRERQIGEALEEALRTLAQLG